MARAIRNRDGSFSIEPEFRGDDISSLGACAGAIAQLHLDEAKVNGRLAKVARDGHGSAMEQARAEIAAEGQMAQAKKWINRMRPGHRSAGGREVRG